MRRILRDHGLLLVNLVLFALFFVGMALTGWKTYDADQAAHGQSAVSLATYLTSGHFIEATFENWESEFLQMGMYVVLTTVLFTRGSSESKSMEHDAEQDEDPRLHRTDPGAPWPVRRGGWVLRVYENSLSLFFFVWFLASILLHAAGGVSEFNSEQALHGAAGVSVWGYLGTSQFWFESFQNWQSEFLAVAAIVGASIWLRQRGSAESKPVHAPHRETGT
jgi:hypothetical protein